MVYIRGKNENVLRDFAVKVKCHQYVACLGRKYSCTPRWKVTLRKQIFTDGDGSTEIGWGLPQTSHYSSGDCYSVWNEDKWFSEAFHSKTIWFFFLAWYFHPEHHFSEPGGPACSSECRWQGSAAGSPPCSQGQPPCWNPVSSLALVSHI